MRFKVAVQFDDRERKLASAIDNITAALDTLNTAHNERTAQGPGAMDNTIMDIMCQLAAQQHSLVVELLGSWQDSADEVCYTIGDTQMSAQAAIAQIGEATLESL